MSPSIDSSVGETDAAERPVELFAGGTSDLWRLDPVTLVATEIGEFTGFEGGSFDCGGLALDSSGTLYALTVGPPSVLYVVDKETAALSNPVTLGNLDGTWGSTVVPAGALAASERLVVAGPAGELSAIDLANGETTSIGSFGGNWHVSGDLAWVEGIGLMGTLDNGDTDRLVTISLTDASISIVGDTGRSNVYGLTAIGDRVWGLTGSQEIFEMDTSDASDLSTQEGGTFWSIAAP